MSEATGCEDHLQNDSTSVGCHCHILKEIHLTLSLIWDCKLECLYWLGFQFGVDTVELSDDGHFAMRLHLARFPPACLVSISAARQVQGRYPCPPGVGRHALSNLADNCCLVTDARPRRLRSADTRMLLVSRTCTNFRDRVFSAVGPRVWNYLPTELRQPDSSCRILDSRRRTFFNW